MPNRERTFEVTLEDGKKVPLGVRFTERALYAWETRGYTMPTREELRAGHTAKLKQLLWAGLEGYRVFHGEERLPWSMDAVNDLVERAGGWGEAFSVPLLDAYAEAFPSKTKPPGGEAPAGKADGGVTASPGRTGPTGEPSSSGLSAAG